MAWSSSARLSALNPHATLSHSNTADQPKQRNPLLPRGDAHPQQYEAAQHVHLAPTADFAATIPLSELIQAEQLSQTMKGTRHGGSSLSETALAASLSQSNNSLARSQAFATGSSPTSTLPLRVPVGSKYSVALAQVHAARADRMQRLPAGWSQAAANDAEAQRREHSVGVAVYSDAAHAELLADALEAQAEQRRKRRVRTAPQRASSDLDGRGVSISDATSPSAAADPSRRRSASRLAVSSAKAEHFWSGVREQEARLAARLAERMEAKHARDEEAFQHMLGQLGQNQDLLANMEQYLALGEAEGERRRERLYQQWCAQVYEPLQSAVQAGLAGRSTSSIEARRQALFADFLQISNSKGATGLYGDVVREEAYDALAARSSVLRVRVPGGPLNDPLKAAEQQREAEWALHQTFYPQATRIRPQVKESLLPPPVWARGRIEATPHGRYSLLRGNVQAPVGKRLLDASQLAALRDSRDPHSVGESFDHYRVDQDPATGKQQYFRRGKRVEGYDQDLDKWGYDILASTEPSVRSRVRQQQQQTQQPPQTLPALYRPAPSSTHFVPSASEEKQAFVPSP